MTSDCIINHWLLDISSASLIHQESGEQRRLGEYQLKLLVVLIQHAGQVLSREELNQLVWERRVIGNNSLPNAIHALRVALEDDGKQQRIIKTVPKRGYILEAEFCQFQHRRDDEDEEDQDAQLLSFTPPPATPAPAIAPAPDFPAATPAPAIVPAQPAVARAARSRWKTGFFFMLMLLIASAGVVIYYASQPVPQLVPVSLDGASQIRLLRLTHTPRDEQTSMLDMPQLLGSTLRELNPLLQQRKVQMDVYYSVAGTTLDLTLNLKSACMKQQLAMSITNRTGHVDALRDLVKTETERKLNEMAPCNP